MGSFYTTAIVNILSWNKAYAIFPLPTFVYYKSFMLEELNSRQAKKVANYARRGCRSQAHRGRKKSNHLIIPSDRLDA